MVCLHHIWSLWTWNLTFMGLSDCKVNKVSSTSPTSDVSSSVLNGCGYGNFSVLVILNSLKVGGPTMRSQNSAVRRGLLHPSSSTTPFLAPSMGFFQPQSSPHLAFYRPLIITSVVTAQLVPQDGFQDSGGSLEADTKVSEDSWWGNASAHLMRKIDPILVGNKNRITDNER